MNWNLIRQEQGPVVLLLGAVFVFGILALVSLTGLGAEAIDASGLCAGPDL